MQIGIPRALLYYYYFPFWKTFFEELGHTVVVSEQTCKELVDEGIKASVPELCVPIKIFTGHVLNLLSKEVDYIFIPRMVTIRKGETFCPKFLGLPDMLRHALPGLQQKILYPQVNTKNDIIDNPKDYFPLAEKLGNSQKEIRHALRKAAGVWLAFRDYSKQGFLINEAMDMALRGQNTKKLVPCPFKGDITIGLLGYVYDIYDEFISMKIIDKLRSLGVNVLTFEMADERKLDGILTSMKKALFWTFTNKLLGAGLNFYQNSQVDGLIHVTAFGCGPDSLLGKLLELESIEREKPFMTIRVDEHTGENHLQTRIEAFVDMLRKRKRTKRGA